MFQVAVENEIPIMTGEWVKAVWEKASTNFMEDTSATHKQFSSYACPVFKALVITVSQLGRKEKESMKKIIEDNGNDWFVLSCVKILIWNFL